MEIWVLLLCKVDITQLKKQMKWSSTSSKFIYNQWKGLRLEASVLAPLKTQDNGL